MAIVLVIDPYEGFREAMLYCLPRFGHSALVAADGETGRRIAASTPVDLVLLDMGYRTQAGFATCEAFKRDVALQRIPIVMMADVISSELAAKSRALGAEEIVPKPVRWPEFLSLLARLAPAGGRGSASVSTL